MSCGPEWSPALSLNPHAAPHPPPEPKPVEEGRQPRRSGRLVKRGGEERVGPKVRRKRRKVEEWEEAQESMRGLYSSGSEGEGPPMLPCDLPPVVPPVGESRDGEVKEVTAGVQVVDEAVCTIEEPPGVASSDEQELRLPPGSCCLMLEESPERGSREAEEGDGVGAGLTRVGVGGEEGRGAGEGEEWVDSVLPDAAVGAASLMIEGGRVKKKWAWWSGATSEGEAEKRLKKMVWPVNTRH